MENQEANRAQLPPEEDSPQIQQNQGNQNPNQIEVQADVERHDDGELTNAEQIAAQFVQEELQSVQQVAERFVQQQRELVATKSRQRVAAP